MNNKLGKFMKIKQISKNKVLVTYEDGKTIKIPSQMFPLNRELEFFTADNTEEFRDEYIESIYNSVTARTGKCYYNAKDLVDALLKSNVDSSRIKTYVGWLFIGDTIPVHHCFVMIDNKHILDFGPLRQFEILYDSNEREELEEFKKELVKNKSLPNSKKMTFGKALNVVAYVVSECSPSDGEKIRAKLEKTFPKHISF